MFNFPEKNRSPPKKNGVFSKKIGGSLHVGLYVSEHVRGTPIPTIRLMVCGSQSYPTASGRMICKNPPLKKAGL